MWAMVHEHERGVEYRWGRYVQTLEPGVYWRWPFSGCEIVKIDARRATLQITGQEVLTAERVPVGLNLLVWYRIAEPAPALHEVASRHDALWQVVQLAARDAVGAREIEQVLTERDEMADEITQVAREGAAAFGIEVLHATVKDLILDHELRSAYQEKLVADERGQAELVAARHEVAAARARANAAKLAADNPAVLAQRQLDVLEKAATSGMSRFVIVAPELAGSMKMDTTE